MHVCTRAGAGSLAPASDEALERERGAAVRPPWSRGARRLRVEAGGGALGAVAIDPTELGHVAGHEEIERKLGGDRGPVLPISQPSMGPCPAGSHG